MNKKIFLIDGHALIFKMYYAFLRRPMINSKGQDTSILFGFTKYVLELAEKEQPDSIAVAFDPPGGTFRNEIYPEYKATRSATPQLVIDALEPLTEICKSLGIPVLMMPGFEADDVIGSMSKICETQGFTVYMVTPDKDYGQLISDNIIQYKPAKGGGEREIIDKKAVCEKYGIDDPLQVIDMLTLCGDTSDNVPGVKGVGEVGAGKLISKYGSVDNIYAHIDELSAKQQEAFKAAESHIGLSRTLVTIKTDIEIDADLSCDRPVIEAGDEAAELFEKYEFTSLKRFLKPGSMAAKVPQESLKIEFETVSPADFIAKAGHGGKVGLSCEMAGDGIFSKITKLTLSVCENGKHYVSEGSADDFKALIQDGSVEKCGYDLKLADSLLAFAGIKLNGRLTDIELMHYLINPEQSHKVELLAKTYLNLDIRQNQEEKVVQMSLFDDAPEDRPARSDKSLETIALYLLSEKLGKELEERGADGLYDGIEEPLIRVLAEMERTGVRIDLGHLKNFAVRLEEELGQRQEKIRAMAEEPQLNISSPKQVGELLFDKLKLDPKAKKKGANMRYSTDEETLSALRDKSPIIDEILEFRAVKKLLSTYIEPFPNFVNPRTGRVHTTFNQALTATGRLSSSKPNLQNIPIRTERGKEIRRAFVAGTAEGLLMSADYSQIELRIMAHLSQDAHLIEAFREGRDVHAATAAKIFGINIDDVTSEQRRIAKTANFGIMYGISAFGLAQRLGVSRSESKKIIGDYFANFPTISTYIADTIASAREKGYVETLFGRRRYLPDINSRNATVKSLAERNAINAPIQGTSADIIKIAMAQVDAEIKAQGLKSRMVLQIHDELLFETSAGEIESLQKIVVGKMENVISLSIPLTVECNYGKTWLEAH